MIIYYFSLDIVGVFYGKLIEIIINKDEKGVSIFLILYMLCGYFLCFVKKVFERLSYFVFLESIFFVWYRILWNFEIVYCKWCCVYVVYVISFISIVFLNLLF